MILAVSLAGRRWGAGRGRLAGRPALHVGTDRPHPGAPALADVRGRNARGILAGTVSQAAFSLAYGALVPGWGWPLCVLAGTIGFAVSTRLLEHLALPPALLAVGRRGARGYPLAPPGSRDQPADPRDGSWAGAQATRRAAAEPPAGSCCRAIVAKWYGSPYGTWRSQKMK